MGKKPDIMGLLKRDEKILELMYVESSRIICTNSKKVDDGVKLWRETLDGMSFIGASCRPAGNQFGFVGLQIADHSEIPLTPHTSHTKSLALEQANTHSPQNVGPSPTVSSPPHNKY
ncbi:hypothetical protein Glove_101g1 [Diversispora epigaea]|uniref:Uncharacterized protein n=1 Tax=Diversispora epigaea TaxID=1348612 RepID=A0A397JCS2_9GLOM|nr:hypothetical protein Glove_101g1 [Diversispora epigaea]